MPFKIQTKLIVLLVSLLVLVQIGTLWGGYFYITHTPQPHSLLGLTALGLTSLLLLIVGGIFLGAQITRPLHLLGLALKRIEQGDYSQPIQAQGDLKFDHLIITFNQMLEMIQAREQALLYQSKYDDITTLPNRPFFFDTLAKYLEKAATTQQPMAIVTIGIDRFVQINHALGHHIGDRLLHHVGERLRDALTNTHMLARLASNLFVAILPDVTPENYHTEAERIIALFDEPFSVYTVHIDLDVLLGFSFYPEHGQEEEVLIQRADVALYSARFAANRYAAYQPDKDPHHFNKISLMSELREGLGQNEFDIYYQPKVNIISGKIVQVEALVRWRHPLKGFMTPDQFIPLAEETGHIKQLTLWLIGKSILQCKLWHDQKIDLGVSINLSVKDLLNNNLVEYVANLLQESAISPEWITFEIVESAFMHDPENAMMAIRKLKALGVHFSVDDFGTGYSSLTYLRHLPVKELKIDQSFIREITQSERVANIVRSTVQLGHSIHMSIVGEGINDQETYDMLKDFGCDIGQGYLFSPPLSLTDFTQWLHTSPWGLNPV